MVLCESFSRELQLIEGCHHLILTPAEPEWLFLAEKRGRFFKEDGFQLFSDEKEDIVRLRSMGG